MTAAWYPFTVRNSTTGGTPVSGLTPTWVYAVQLDTGSGVTGPAITEITEAGSGYGAYKYQWDVAVSGEFIGQVDCGSGLSLPGDRYHDLWATYANFQQPNDIVSVGTTVQTESYAAVGDTASIAQLLYAIYSVLTNIKDTGNNIIGYELNATTPAITMTLDNPTAPTQRLRTS